MTADQFHEAIHVAVGRPRREIQTRYVGKSTYKCVIDEPWAHRASWASSVVNLMGKTISLSVKVNLKQNSLEPLDFVRLSGLALEGIRRYWSRTIHVENEEFRTDVVAKISAAHGLGFDLYINNDESYARSSNLAILGIDGSLKYNRGFFPMAPQADQDFMLTAAHEFGHSVLTEYGGIARSWTHEGSTSIFQSTKTSTPGYPTVGEIDLMKYYDDRKSYPGPALIAANTRASEFDLKCLMWMGLLSIS